MHRGRLLGGECRISGMVFADNNGNGRREGGEPGMPGVWISDGERIAQSDQEGRYSLTISLDTLRWVAVTRPEGWCLTTPFYMVLDPEQHAGQEVVCNFGLAPDRASARDNFCFLVGGDSQFSRASQAEWLRGEMARIGDICRDNGAAFLCIIGDLTQSGFDQQFRWYLEALAELGDVKVYNLFGGHDGLYDREDHPPGRITNYIKYCGPAWYSWEYGPYHFVAHVPELAFLTEAERQRHDLWLQADIAKVPGDKYLIVTGHYPPTNENMQAWLADHKVAGVLYGHWHERGISQFRTGRDEQPVIPYLLTAPLRSSPDSGAFAAGVRLVHLAKGEIWTRTFIPSRLAAPPAPPPVSDAPSVELGRGWPQLFSGDLGPRVTSVVLKPPLKIAWRVPTGAHNSMFNSPIVYQGRVIVGVYDGEWHGDRPGSTMAAFEGQTGREMWRTAIDSDVRFAPCASRGRVYALSGLGTVYCLDVATGRIIWQRWLYGENDRAGGHRLCQSMPVIHRGRLLCVGQDGPLFILDPETGEIVADVDVKNHPRYAAPAIGRGKMFFAAEGVTTAVDLATLKVLWQTPTPGTRAVSTPCPGGDTVFINGTTFYGLDADTGKIRWSRALDMYQDLGSLSVLAAVAYDGLVYGGGRKFMALNAENGETVWQFSHGEYEDELEETEGRSLGAMSTPLIAGDLIWLGSDDGHLYALDRHSGVLSWRQYLAAPIKSSPVISGNALYVPDFDGNLYCLVGNPP